MKKALNVIFVLCLFLPLLAYLFSSVKVSFQSENRNLVAFPKISKRQLLTTGFAQQFEVYWHDHFGFRGRILSSYALLQQKVFNKSTRGWVIQGEDGWLFYNLRKVVADYLGLRNVAPELLQDWVDTVENREKWLAGLGIHYILLPVPTKMNVYPEFLPTRYHLFKKGDGVTVLESFLSSLQENPGISCAIHLSPLFREKKDDALLYYKKGTHWTSEGAFVAYGEIVKRLQRWYPHIEAMPRSSLKITSEAHTGDLALMLGSGRGLVEEAVNIQIPHPAAGKMVKLAGHNPAATKVHPVKTKARGRELSAVVVHDSFGTKLNPFIAEHFGTVVYVWTQDFGWLKEFLQKERPDVLIHEQVAWKLETMLDDSWSLAEELGNSSE